MSYAFADCLLDPALRELRVRGAVVPVEPQVFDLVLYLLRHRDRVVSTDELVDAVWGGRIVSDSTIRNRINAARTALDDDGRRQTVIRTVPRRGLRLIAEVVETGEGPAVPQDDGAVAEPPVKATGRKPVVAVLPFVDLGGDSRQGHLGDGITEDIITILARHRSLTVVARNSVFAFKGRAGDVREAGAALGADYVVEGSVRRNEQALRITAHLIRTDTGQLLWGDRLDRPVEALFDVQDEITNRIVAAVEPQIGQVERALAGRRKPASLRAWDLFQLGTAHLYRATRRDNREAQRLLRQAIDVDPELPQAYAHLSYAVLLSMLYFDADPEEDRLAEAHTLARRAVELDAGDAMTRFVYGRVLLARRDYAGALQELEQAVDLNPALAIGHCGVGDSLAYEGRYDEAFPHFQRAIELSPYDPQRWAFLAYRALAHLFGGQYRLAADWAAKATRVPGCHYWPYAHRVAALGHLDCGDETSAAVQALHDKRPGFTCRTARERLFYIRDAGQIDSYVAGLRRAGIGDR